MPRPIGVAPPGAGRHLGGRGGQELGRVALASTAVAVRAGFNYVGLDVTAGGPGLYVLKVRTATGPLSQRVIIVR